MTNRLDEGQVNTQRRIHLLRVAQAAAGIAGWSTTSAWAAARKSQKNIRQPAPPPIPKPEKRNITLATTNALALPYLPLLVAQQKGFFAQQGIELQISEQQSAARAIAAVGSGSADLVCGWFENMLSAPGRAMALQSFVMLGITPMMALGVPLRSTSQPLMSLAELRGRKLGVVALNSPTHTVALAALRRAGLRSSDLGFVSVGSPVGALAALRSGQIDALMHMDPLMLQLEQRSEIVTLLDMRSPTSSMEALGKHLPSSCVAAPQEFLQRYPGSAQACSDALVQALRWLQQASLRDMLYLLPDKATSAESALNAPAMDAQLFVASFNRLRSAYSVDGLCAPALGGNLLQAMVEAEPALRLEEIDVQRSINNTFAQRSAGLPKA
jgi:NitT/TauT family transport system substrate-binding protein